MSTSGIYMHVPRNGQPPSVMIVAGNPHMVAIKAACEANGYDLFPLSKKAFDEFYSGFGGFESR